MANERIANNVYLAALGGLLHDVGKFTGRAAVGRGVSFTPDEQKGIGYRHAEDSQTFVDTYVPQSLRPGLGVVRYHHRPANAPTDDPAIRAHAHLVCLADWWAAGERQTQSPQQAGSREAALTPILYRVRLEEPVPDPDWGHRLSALQITREAIFPVLLSEGEKLAGEERYTGLWEDMRAELERWKRDAGEQWDEQPFTTYFTTLLALLRKYLSLVPSATPWQADEDDRVWPDVSLYDHLKTTSAIALCLAAAFDTEEILALDARTEQEVALMVRGDFSGIQRFIYRITRPEAETEHVAKRLRGRSFYLALLGDVVTDWLVRELKLTPANVLFSGGGRFDLLIPLCDETQTRLKTLLGELESWLLKAFYGELGIQFATTPVRPSDFADMRAAYERLDTALGKSKLRKWHRYLTDNDFFVSQESLWHACRVCCLTPLLAPGTCYLCQQHEQIGKALPHTTHLAFLYGDESLPLPGDRVLRFDDSPFDVSVGLVCGEDEVTRLRNNWSSPAVIYRINNTDDFLRSATTPAIASSFRFLANSAPLARRDLHVKGAGPVSKADVLHFEAIAELSTGAKRLGVLKADVDMLGSIFGEGLSGEGDAPESLRPTISRVSALSNTLETFFAGWLNEMCCLEFDAWRNDPQNEHPWREAVDGLFYVMYAGGDDLFVVGPWDATLKLARRLQEDFEDYACRNLNVRLSAGYVQVKPRYPAQKFAELASDAEHVSKSKGRNRITLFGQTVEWGEEGNQYQGLLKLADDLCDAVRDREMPRTLIHDLGQLHRQRQPRRDAPLKPMWTPRLFYTMTRRLLKDVRERFKMPILKAMRGNAILIPVSYVSLITRKE